MTDQEVGFNHDEGREEAEEACQGLEHRRKEWSKRVDLSRRLDRFQTCRLM